MVKIVGDAPETFKQTTCFLCCTKLEYSQSEVKEWHGKDYSGGSAGKEWIDCPKCGKEVILCSW